tara:strand:- start:643 stop:1203 length:561 start_codon:yes stop_codon:yes gene_type:complete
MAQFGTSFLKEFYEGLIRSGSGFGYAALSGNTVVGFIMGVYNRTGLIGKVIKSNFFRVTIAVFMALIRDIRKLNTILDIVKKEKDMENDRAYSDSESLFIAINPDIKKGMLFYQLIHALNRHFLEQGIEVYSGRVLKSNPIINVFRRMPGFEPIEEVTIYGLKWVLYRYRIKKGFKELTKLAVKSI